jgi:hypothetical protein
VVFEGFAAADSSAPAFREVCGVDPDMLESHNEPDNDLDADLDAEFDDTVWVSCAYCGEASELGVDLAGGAVQEYVQDCEVCCHPWLVRVELDGEGYVSVLVTTLDDE